MQVTQSICSVISPASVQVRPNNKSLHQMKCELSLFILQLLPQMFVEIKC